MSIMPEPALTGRWRWHGEPTVRQGRRHYKAARKTFDDIDRDPLLVRLGDVIVMRVVDDPEPWVAQCVDFADFEAEELKEMLGPDAEHEEEDEDEDEIFREVVCMRAAFRWLNRPQDVRTELADVHGHPREVFMTDYIAPLHYNSVGVIDDVVVVKPSLAELQAAGTNPEHTYFCNRFFWTEAAKNSPPPNSKLAESGDRLRRLRKGELEMILSRPTTRDTLFWRVINPRPAARKSFSGSMARQTSETRPQRRVGSADEELAARGDVSRSRSAEVDFDEKKCSPKALESRVLRHAVDSESDDGGNAPELARGGRPNAEAHSALGAISDDAAMPDWDSPLAADRGSTCTEVPLQRKGSAPALCNLAAEERELDRCMEFPGEDIRRELLSDDDSCTRPAISFRNGVFPKRTEMEMEMLWRSSEFSKVDGAVRDLAPEQRSSFTSFMGLILRKSNDRLAQARHSGSTGDLERAKTAVAEELAKHARDLLSSAEAARRAVQ